MAATYLIGGGWPPDPLDHLYAAFATEVADRPGELVYLLQKGVNPKGWRRYFLRLGLPPARQVTVGPGKAVRPEDIGVAAGMFVCGGDNPLYQGALAEHAHEVRRHLAEHDIPYAGFSAGAAVAGADAVIGGAVRGRPDGSTVPVAPSERDEGLPVLAVLPGLGLVPFGVDIHATQWGTLTRLIHSVATGLVEEGWGLDAHAGIRVNADGRTDVFGPGNVYRVLASGPARAGSDRDVRVRILPPGRGPTITPRHEGKPEGPPCQGAERSSPR
ncbi:hypothetical protein ACH5A3_42560 [Streptomyces echinatus]|uniref:hypothetical protein n=1 Tax=Streptomyces echinatus TaxID=67293 RepID=UPI00378E8FF8